MASLASLLVVSTGDRKRAKAVQSFECLEPSHTQANVSGEREEYYSHNSQFPHEQSTRHASWPPNLITPPQTEGAIAASLAAFSGRCMCLIPAHIRSFKFGGFSMLQRLIRSFLVAQLVYDPYTRVALFRPSKSDPLRTMQEWPLGPTLGSRVAHIAYPSPKTAKPHVYSGFDSKAKY